MNIIQEQYEKINTINDFPIAIYTAFRNCDNYDWNRGRLTNYFAFGIEALVRGWLPLPFISWITMLILLLNAVLLGKLIIKEIKPQTTRVSIFCLVVLFVVLNPSFVYSYETQFIYPKYLCITFILLFMLTGNMLLKGLLILCLIFADEIGLIFGMVIIFLSTIHYFPYCCGEAYIQGSVSSKIKQITAGIFASIALLFVYFGILGFVFKLVPSIIHRNIVHFDRNVLQILSVSSAYLFKIVCSTFGMCSLEVNPLSPTTSTSNVNWWLVVVAGFIFVFVLLRAKRLPPDSPIGKRKRFADIFSTTFSQSWNISLQIYGSATLVLVFIIYIMYRGSVSDYTYYTYPISMIVSFLFLSFLVKKLPHHYICMSLSLIIIFLCIQFPKNLNEIGRRIQLEYFLDKTVTSEKFAGIDTAIKEIRLSGNKTIYNSINNQQEIDYIGGHYQYGSNYFPVAGIVRVLVWPKKVDGSRTKYCFLVKMSHSCSEMDVTSKSAQ
jgi:hypothetical protein